jgi:hypothetical protein
MLTTALILSFCTTTICEEYVIDHNLTKSDCIERKKEETVDMKGESFDQLYKDAVDRYQAVAMTGKIVDVSLKCVMDY